MSRFNTILLGGNVEKSVSGCSIELTKRLAKMQADAEGSSNNSGRYVQ